MAFHKHFKLPPFKLTQRSAAGTQVRDLHRGASSQQDSSNEPSSLPGHDASIEQSQSFLEPDAYFQDSSALLDEPTTHELQSKASVKGWDNLRKGLLSAAVECSAMPIGQHCLLCPSPAVFRCQQCGPLIHYCYNCFCTQHKKANFFHVAEKWEVDHYVQVSFEKRQMNVRPSHVCDTSKELSLQCLDEHGVEHSILFVYCDCEPVAITLVRAQLWPASPSYPRYAFSFALLDWAESLLLECQVALKDFCQALYFRCPYPMSKRREVYTSLIDSFEEYRFFKHDMRHLSFLSESIDSGNVCPACPKDGGKIVYALDGLFGLPRKRSAGVSYRPAVHGSLFFCDQQSVDEFVMEAPDSKRVGQECNDFLAGNMLRSSTRYRALDETAVFGSACRHEFPALFFSLKHGERLAYSVWMIDKLIERHLSNSATDIYIMYDIACTLRKHLEICGREDVLNNVHLCLPSFHCYGHKASCQITCGPLRCEGIGLSDGETMERMWSYLRRFGRMTKEMRPAHRVDVLAHALVYYGMKTKDKLAHLLVTRWERAQQIHTAAEETFQNLAGLYEGGEVSKHTIQAWLVEETIIANDQTSARETLPHWKCDYFLMLQSYFHQREKLTQSGQLQQEKLTLCHEVSRLDKQLKEVERQHQLPYRWTPTDAEYLRAKLTFSTEKQEQIGESLWASSIRRGFLLKLKAKYADGQKIAKKLSIQISKETKRVKTLLQEYNACQTVVAGSYNRLTIDEVLDSSTLAKILHPKLCRFTLDKQQLIDAYITMVRSEEEIHMLEAEMGNTVQHYEHRKTAISEAIEHLSQADSLFDRGAHALLVNLLHDTNVQLEKSRRLFSACLHHIPFTADDSDVSSDSESDTDTD